MSIQVFVDFARKRLEPILDKSGTILYSSFETLRPGRYYFLGLNPGGSEDGTHKICESLNELESGTPTANAYLGQDWSGTRNYGIGGHPLQRNYRYLFSELGEKPESICASNLIFTRSVGEKGAGGTARAELCWPVHQLILEIVCPATIITFGRQPFNFIYDQLGGTAPTENPSGHGSWTWRHSTLKNGENLIGLPHLSRYTLRNHAHVINEIKKLLG